MTGRLDFLLMPHLLRPRFPLVDEVIEPGILHFGMVDQTPHFGLHFGKAVMFGLGVLDFGQRRNFGL